LPCIIDSDLMRKRIGFLPRNYKCPDFHGLTIHSFDNASDDFDGNTAFQALIMNVCARQKETGQMACLPFTDPAFRAETSSPAGQVVQRHGAAM